MEKRRPTYDLDAIKTTFGKYLEAANNLLSVCVQHEMDHLIGKLFVDHVSALKRELIRRRMKRLKAQRAAERKGEATAL